MSEEGSVNYSQNRLRAELALADANKKSIRSRERDWTVERGFADTTAYSYAIPDRANLLLESIANSLLAILKQHER
jgi:hypothetical protein